jgi:uncharacterized repeat protein (TIGR03806 family)
VKRLVAAVGLWLASIGASSPAPVNDALILSDALPATLSEFRLLSGPYGETPNARVTRYTLNTPLFSDYAEKWRYAYVPAGQSAQWRDDGVLDFPVGSVLVKSFGYPADMRTPAANIKMLETRLLIRRAAGWVALPYVWNADGSDAVLKRAGTRIPVSWTHSDGSTRTISYAVPNANQCKGCHEAKGAITPIGPKAINLDDGAQLQRLVADKMLDRVAPGLKRLPVWNDPASGSTAERARAYLDVNCAHCHNRDGPANTSGLWLGWQEPVGPNLGFGKRPTAAGRGSGNLDFAIAPGHPEQSYLIYRMNSLDPGIAMPELGRASVHSEGVALLSQWISETK